MKQNEVVVKLQRELKNNDSKIKKLKKKNRTNKIALSLLLLQIIVIIYLLTLIFPSLLAIFGLFFTNVLITSILLITFGIIGISIGISKPSEIFKKLKKEIHAVLREDKKYIMELTIKNELIKKELEKAKKYANSVDNVTLQHLLHLETMLDEYITRRKYYQSKYHKGLLFTTNLNIEETALMEEIIYEDTKIKTRGRLK